MNRILVPFIAISVFLHLSLFLLSGLRRPSFEIPIQSGGPFEISKQTPRSRSAETTAVADATTEKGSTLQRSGITDGTELGISKPKYPESSRLRGEEGKALLKLSFDNAKALVKVEVIESSGYPELDRSGVVQVEKDLPHSQGNIIAFEHLVQFNFFLTGPK